MENRRGQRWLPACPLSLIPPLTSINNKLVSHRFPPREANWELFPFSPLSVHAYMHTTPQIRSIFRQYHNKAVYMHSGYLLSTVFWLSLRFALLAAEGSWCQWPAMLFRCFSSKNSHPIQVNELLLLHTLNNGGWEHKEMASRGKRFARYASTTVVKQGTHR